MANNNHKSEILKEVSVSEILTKIENDKQVEYNDAIIKNDLNINALDLPKKHFFRDEFYKNYFDLRNEFKIVRSFIKFTNCTFEGYINLDNTIFEGEIIFKKCKFNKYVHFMGCQFRNISNFEGSQFNKFVDFSYSEFGAALFIGSRFNIGAYFMISLFNGAAFFNGSQFNNGETSFFRSKFGNFSQFNGAQFEKVDFNESEFRIVFFEKAMFNGTAMFSDCKFWDSVSFKESEFNKFVDFKRAMFRSDIDLSKSKFDKVVDFREASFHGWLRLNYSNFATLELPWSLIKEKLSYNGSTYLALVKNYNNLGWYDDADNCFYSYKNKDYLQNIKNIVLTRSIIQVVNNLMKYKKRNHINEWRILKFIVACFNGVHNFINNSTRILFPFFSLILYGHGVRLIWPFAIGAAVLLLSAYIYYSGGQVGSFYPEGIKISFEIFTTTTQVGSTSRVDSLTGFCRDWSIIERFLGWILMTTFLVVLAKKTLR